MWTNNTRKQSESPEMKRAKMHRYHSHQESFRRKRFANTKTLFVCRIFTGKIKGRWENVANVCRKHKAAYPEEKPKEKFLCISSARNYRHKFLFFFPIKKYTAAGKYLRHFLMSKRLNLTSTQAELSMVFSYS